VTLFLFNDVLLLTRKYQFFDEYRLKPAGTLFLKKVFIRVDTIAPDSECEIFIIFSIPYFNFNFFLKKNFHFLFLGIFEVVRFEKEIIDGEELQQSFFLRTSTENEFKDWFFFFFEKKKKA